MGTRNEFAWVGAGPRGAGVGRAGGGMSEEAGFCCGVPFGLGGGGVADALWGLFAAGKDGL